MSNPENRAPVATILAFSILALMIIIGGGLLLLAQPAPVRISINPPLPTTLPTASPTPAPIQVYITGAVNNPQQVFVLPHDSHVQDVITAASGLTSDADLSRVNLAARVRDGDQIHVPSLSSADTASDSGGTIPLPTPSGGTLIYLNSATSAELQTIPGIGEVLAGRIIAYREANGPFASIDDLMNVSGIGERTLENIRPFVAVD